ncbi:MAG: hypothetical protein QOF14_4449 [Hyphomicrobiales bacterium]|nr:hypothetical protein [Hyphomicrobiales bacterium]
MRSVWTSLVVLLLLSTEGLAQDERMARVAPVPSHTSDPILAPLFDGVRARGGEPLNMHRVLGNAPKIFKAYVDIAYALRSSADVAREFRELIILRTVQLSGGEYEFVQHRPMALSCGMSPAQIDAIANWRESSSFDARQRAVLAYADEVAAEKGVSDAAFQALAQFFNPQEIVELTITAGFYTAASRITKALDIKIEKGAGQAVSAYGKC